MASIRSVLIKTCMANIQKEIGQLEHWLLNLPNDTEELSQESSLKKDSYAPQPSMDLTRLYEGIERMTQQLNFQQITLAHITDRIEILENFREVPIQQKAEANTWLDDAVNLDEEDEEDVPIIHVVHMDEFNQKVDASEPNVSSQEEKDDTSSSVAEPIENTPVISPIVSDAKDIMTHVASSTSQSETSQKEEEVPEEMVSDPSVEEEEPEQPEEEKKPEEPEQPEEEEQEQPEEEKKPEEPEEEEEEEQPEEEMEGTVFEYKDITYYRDLDNHVFAVDENGELSDMAIGFWKEKTQTILFYKMK